MNYLTLIMLVFALLGAVDYAIGSRFGLGKEFEKAFMLFGTMALSMIGMIILAPVLADWIQPFSSWFSSALHIDSSIIPASLFANDMGGAPLSVEMASNENLGLFNALVVSSMMGCTVSFTIPFSLGLVPKHRHDELFLGLLCGIITIPVGCFFAGLFCPLPLGTLLLDLIPLLLFSLLIALGITYFPQKCIRIFQVFGKLIRIVITCGLALGLVRFLTGWEILPGLATFEEGASICLNAVAVLAGTFPLVHIISRLLDRPLKKAGKAIGVNTVSIVCLLSSLATSATAFGKMDEMDKKGAVLNSAFAVSAAFTFGGHMAFTMAFDAQYIFPMIIGKLVAGFLALLLAHLVSRKMQGNLSN